MVAGLLYIVRWFLGNIGNNTAGMDAPTGDEYVPV